MANKITDLAAEKSKPLGDTGDGQTGVPADEQGISNRPGDSGDGDDSSDDEEDEAAEDTP